MGVLGGCGNAIPEMTTEETRLVGEYAAIAMLRYDANHRSRLVDLSLYPEEPEVTEVAPVQPQPQQIEQAPSEQTQVQTTPEVSEPTFSSAEEFLGLPSGVALTYRGFTVSDSYPEDFSQGTYFSVDATAGKKFVVLHFDLQNQSGSDQSFDFLYDGITFKAVINDSITKTALVTMLNDDMSTYLGSIANGGSEPLVLLFELEAADAENVSTVALNLKSDSNAYTIQLN